MADAPASRQTVLQLAESLKAYTGKIDNLSEQMTSLQLQLARQEGAAMPVKLAAVESDVAKAMEEIRSLKESRAAQTGAVKAIWAVISALGISGIIAFLRAYGK